MIEKTRFVLLILFTAFLFSSPASGETRTLPRGDYRIGVPLSMVGSVVDEKLELPPNFGIRFNSPEEAIEYVYNQYEINVGGRSVPFREYVSYRDNVRNLVTLFVARYQAVQSFNRIDNRQKIAACQQILSAWEQPGQSWAQSSFGLSPLLAALNSQAVLTLQALRMGFIASAGTAEDDSRAPTARTDDPTIKLAFSDPVTAQNYPRVQDALSRYRCDDYKFNPTDMPIASIESTAGTAMSKLRLAGTSDNERLDFALLNGKDSSVDSLYVAGLSYSLYSQYFANEWAYLVMRKDDLKQLDNVFDAGGNPRAGAGYTLTEAPNDFANSAIAVPPKVYLVSGPGDPAAFPQAFLQKIRERCFSFGLRKVISQQTVAQIENLFRYESDRRFSTFLNFSVYNNVAGNPAETTLRSTGLMSLVWTREFEGFAVTNPNSAKNLVAFRPKNAAAHVPDGLFTSSALLAEQYRNGHLFDSFPYLPATRRQAVIARYEAKTGRYPQFKFWEGLLIGPITSHTMFMSGTTDFDGAGNPLGVFTQSQMQQVFRQKRGSQQPSLFTVYQPITQDELTEHLKECYPPTPPESVGSAIGFPQRPTPTPPMATPTPTRPPTPVATPTATATATASAMPTPSAMPTSTWNADWSPTPTVTLTIRPCVSSNGRSTTAGVTVQGSSTVTVQYSTNGVTWANCTAMSGSPSSALCAANAPAINVRAVDSNGNVLASDTCAPARTPRVLYAAPPVSGR